MDAIMTADFMRGIMVSASALIIGFSSSSTYQVLMGHKLGKVFKVPGWVNLLFLVGYNLLLISVIVGRWISIGEPINLASLIASVGLTLNVVSVLSYSWYIRGQ